MSLRLTSLAALALASCTALASDTAEGAAVENRHWVLHPLGSVVAGIPTARAPAAPGPAPKIAGEFRFTESPAWSAEDGPLYFSDKFRA